MSNIKQLTDSDYAQVSQNGDLVGNMVVIYFYADWCDICRALEPHLEKVAERNPAVLIAKFNMDESPRTSAEFGIKCLPTLVFLRDGLEVERIVGAVTERAIENTLKDALMEVKPIYEDIKKTLGISFVPNLFQAMGNHPEYLEVTWNQFKVAMGPGELTPREKELVALAVSATNHCKYCIGAHTAALRRLGLTEKGLIELMGVVGLFNNLNKFLAGLQVEPDLGA